MVIQGSTTVFPLRVLLTFFGDTTRSGELVVETPARAGVLAFRRGRLVALGLGTDGRLPAPAPTAAIARPGDVVLDLVSLPGGRFTFRPAAPDGPAAPAGGDDGLDVREALALAGLDPAAPLPLPDGDARVRITPELPGASVTVPPELWEVLARIEDDVSLVDLASHLGLGLATVRRRVDGLAVLGLAELDGSGVAAGSGSRPEATCR